MICIAFRGILKIRTLRKKNGRRVSYMMTLSVDGVRYHISALKLSMEGGVRKTDLVNCVTPWRKWGTFVLCLGPIIVRSVVLAGMRLRFSHATVLCTFFTATPRYPMMSGEDWKLEKIA